MLPRYTVDGDCSTFGRASTFYLLGYFGVTAAAIAYASVSKKIDSPTHAILLAAVLFINMGVWLLEQLVKIDFDLLSISYILSELFLLGICMVLQEFSPMRKTPSKTIREGTESAPEKETEDPENAAPGSEKPLDERCAFLLSQLPRLTPTERIFYDYYLEGKSTKEIMAASLPFINAPFSKSTLTFQGI